MHGNGQLLTPGPQMAPQTILATPFNDAQLVAFIAAHCAVPDGHADPQEVVQWAVDVVAWSVLAVNGGALSARIKELQAAMQEQADDR